MRTTTARRVLAALAALVLLAGLTACDRASGKDRLTIGLAVANLQQDFFNLIKQSAQRQAGEREVELLVADAKNDPVWQIDQIQSFITRRVDAIVYIPAGASAAGVPVRMAHDADIPVVTVDRNPPDQPGDSFIATDSVAAARQLGEHLVRITDGTSKLGVLQGQLGTTPELARAKGFDAALADAPGLRRVARQSAGWAQDEAFSVAQDMLQAHPGINAFFGRSDAMALGAAQAVRAAGIRRPVTIVGFDGDFAALEAVRDGTLAATMCQQTRRMGALAVDTALDLVHGRKVPREQLLPAFLVRQHNAQKFLDNHP